ncbi:MAG: TlpA family protein disulfide reductase [Gammaproteobacteria bacterium]|nr:TlpA family protein disulfide reductase [Gammaproteobacteria bacterium]
MSETDQTPRGYAGWPRWLRWSLELSGFVMVLLLVQHWQTRDMLPVDPQQSAPPLQGVLLDGGELDISTLRGRPVLVYFFAPWCKVCAFSASSLQRLRDDHEEQELGMVMVALSYDTVGAVREFRDEHELTIPVLLGNQHIAASWSIYGFPTYYVLDGEGHVASRDFGVSTTAGLRFRIFQVQPD